MNKGEVAYLRLLPQVRQDELRVQCLHQTGQFQPSLFPTHSPDSLCFIDMSAVSGSYFMSLLDTARPQCLVDVRPVPRFDIDMFNRKLVFEEFRKRNVRYIDFTGKKEIFSNRDSRLNPSLFGACIQEYLPTREIKGRGPIFFLFDDRSRALSYAETLPGVLNRQKSKQWDVFIY